MNKVIAIVGPTGSGKTKLSIALAKRINGEVINADSTQIYKELDIATSKIKREEMEDIPHHLIDEKEITQDYTVYHFQKDCRRLIEEIRSRGRVPILVGGTGLYVKAALYNYEFNETEEMQNEYLELSNEELYAKVKEIDENTGIHPNNRKRLVREYNYYQSTGRVRITTEKRNEPLYEIDLIGLTLPREGLYDKINQNVEAMFEKGLLEEAKTIYEKGVRSKAVMTPIGYAELFDYFDGNISLDYAKEKMQKKSRNYAKRQYTWFYNQMDVTWFDVYDKSLDQLLTEVERHIRKEE